MIPSVFSLLGIDPFFQPELPPLTVTVSYGAHTTASTIALELGSLWIPSNGSWQITTSNNQVIAPDNALEIFITFNRPQLMNSFYFKTPTSGSQGAGVRVHEAKLLAVNADNSTMILSELSTSGGAIISYTMNNPDAQVSTKYLFKITAAKNGSGSVGWNTLASYVTFSELKIS